MDNDLKKLYPKISPTVLQIKKKIVIKKIKNYLNKDFSDDEVLKNFPEAILIGIGDEINNDSHKGIQTQTQGQRSITYRNNSDGLSNDVISLLPLPFIKLMG